MAMDGQPFTLEELIDEATDINNFASNDVQAAAVANQVNRTISGPNTAVKFLIQKIQMRQEVVTLQALNVVEVCVKNCGVNFHNEVGKYKFINELIKVLSSKYDGDITPQSVKERVISLMFSWYVGLPQQTKISEAYKMLKQQGIIKRDPVDPNRTGNQPLPRENENTAFTDEGNKQLLQTLLSSKDPNDLHSANKLIKTMVKEEEDRLDRVSKRIQVLETVTNNVKLLDDMIAKHEPGLDGSSIEIMNELYERCLTLRPELFRLASKNVEEKDDSVADILLGSDELTRVIDSYKENVLFKASGDRKKPSPVSTSQTNSQAATDSFCLLDLGMDSPTEPNGGKVESSLLDDQFILLGLTTPTTETKPPVGNVPEFPAIQANWNTLNASFPVSQINPIQHCPISTLPSSSNIIPNSNTISILGPNFNSQPIRPPNSTLASAGVQQPSNNLTPKKDLLDFDIFESDFLKNTKPGDKSETNTNVMDNFAGVHPPLPVINNTDSNYMSPATASPVLLPAVPLIDPMSPVLPIASGPRATLSAQMPGTLSPLVNNQVKNVTNAPPTPANYLVPLETLKSGKYDPIPVLDKDGIKTFLLIAEDARADANPNVIVSILSTISLNTTPLADFNLQVAVPKIMRVKLQPATANHLVSFNPLVAPPSISQIMLIANPNKEVVKLRFKISYNLGGVPHVETANVDNLPVR